MPQSRDRFGFCISLNEDRILARATLCVNSFRVTTFMEAFKLYSKVLARLTTQV